MTDAGGEGTSPSMDGSQNRSVTLHDTVTAALAAARETLAGGTRTPIPDAPGYSITREGVVWSDASDWRGYGARELSQGLHDGYPRVRIMINGLRKNRMVHRLMAETFLGPRAEGMQVCHVDGNRENNHIENLRYGTAQDNADDRSRHGRTAHDERTGTHIYTDGQIRFFVGLVNGGMSLREVSRRHGIDRNYLQSVINGEFRKGALYRQASAALGVVCDE